MKSCTSRFFSRTKRNVLLFKFFVRIVETCNHSYEMVLATYLDSTTMQHLKSHFSCRELWTHLDRNPLVFIQIKNLKTWDLTNYIAHFLFFPMVSFIAQLRPPIMRYCEKSAQQIAICRSGTLAVATAYTQHLIC